MVEAQQAKIVAFPIEFPATNMIDSTNVMFTESNCYPGVRRIKRERKIGTGYVSYGVFLMAGSYVMQAWYTTQDSRQSYVT
eukprot:TRINITY_DN8634_c0_g1_i1.p1 TRINITY_DN8634_c0_g1~~TRINITY_DN8634_c0_g1_i1.p1  ORF type:complete len:81 (-),score=6.63 TRINITY_DN8634_c0_g1_i1:250-492(-)